MTFFEMPGIDDAAHALRTAITEGRLKLGTVTSDARTGLVAKDIDKSAEGLVLLSTTTRGSVDYELATRVVLIELEHDQALARAVYLFKASQTAHSSSKGGEEVISESKQEDTADSSPSHQNETDFSLWQNADHLLQSLEVTITYAPLIASLFPTVEERYHRDLDKVFALIKAFALLFQYQRERDKEGRVVATEEDYVNVYRLRRLISESASPASQPILTFLNTIEDLTDKTDKDGAPTREAVQKALDKGNSTIGRYVSQCSKKGWISTEGIGKRQKLNLNEIPGLVSPLPSPEKIFPKIDEEVSSEAELPNFTKETPPHTPMSSSEENDEKIPDVQGELWS